MKIRDLRLSDFARLDSRQFTFQPGINLLCGGNSSGKSSLVRALGAALSDRLPDGYQNSEGKAPPAVALRVDTQSGEQLIERVFVPDEAASPGAQPWGNPTLAAAMIWEDGGLLSLPAESLRLLLRQLALVEDQADARILPHLQAEYRRLTARDPWGDERPSSGELEQVRERLAEIELHWEDRLAALKQLGALRDVLPDAAPEASVEAVSTVVEELPKESLPESSEVDVPGAHVPVVIDGDEFDWDTDETNSTPSDPAKVRERLWAVQKEAAALRHELVAVPSLSPLFPSVLTALFAVLGIALASFHRDLWQAAALAFAALSLCTWGVFAYLARNKGGELASLRERLGQAEREREALLQELDRLDEQRRYGPRDDAEPPRLHPEQTQDDTPEPVEEGCEVDAATPDNQVAADMPQPVSAWQRRRQLLAQVSDLRALEMEGETLRYREEKIVTRLKVLTTAIEMLLQAEDQFSGARRTELGEAINRHLSHLVADPPVTVSLGSNWQLELFSSVEERALGLRELSRGERTLVSLALHLALIELCDEGGGLPLIADDLLDDLQREWRDGVIKGLERFAGTHQLILSSRDPELQTRALSHGWNVVSLDPGVSAPSTRKKPKGSPERSDDEQQLHLL